MLKYYFWFINININHIKMISEGSCDIEAWSNDNWKFSFASQE